jgi:hypothetical protein
VGDDDDTASGFWSRAADGGHRNLILVDDDDCEEAFKVDAAADAGNGEAFTVDNDDSADDDIAAVDVWQWLLLLFL